MNASDPLDNLGGGDAMSGGDPSAPGITTSPTLVSGHSKKDLEGFGMNMVDGYRDLEHELLSWPA